MTNSTPTLQAHEELELAYQFLNNELFEGKLPKCLFTLQREKSSMGYFCRKRFSSVDGEVVDEIAMNPMMFGVVPQIEILSTQLHEACHNWQFHFGKPGRGRYHNREWADKMIEVGLMPSDTGKPGGKQTGDRMSDYIIPDGRFIKAAEKLFATGFRYSWYDRYVRAADIIIYGGKSSYGLPEMGDKISSSLGGNLTMIDIAADADMLEAIDKLDSQSENNSNDADKENASNLTAAQVECHSTSDKPKSGGAKRDLSTPEAVLAAHADGKLFGRVTTRRIEEERGGEADYVQTTNGKRQKYGCQCGNSIWGRSGLKLQCMECKTILVAL